VGGDPFLVRAAAHLPYRLELHSTAQKEGRDDSVGISSLGRDVYDDEAAHWAWKSPQPVAACASNGQALDYSRHDALPWIGSAGASASLHGSCANRERLLDAVPEACGRGMFPGDWALPWFAIWFHARTDHQPGWDGEPWGFHKNRIWWRNRT